MIILRLFLIVGAGALAAAIFWAMNADPRGLASIIEGMSEEPWTVVTLIDLYLGFGIVALVICIFEKTWPVRILAATPVFILGNVWAALWLIVRLPEIARRLQKA